MEQQTLSYEARMAARLANYIEYYENPECRRKEGMIDPLSLEQLNELSIEDLLDIMPSNRTVEKPAFAIVGFEMHKTIDGGWHLSYKEGHQDKPLKAQYELFELWCKNLKLGLIDMYLRVQTYDKEWWNGVKSGRIDLHLGESWENREELGLPARR